MKYLKLSQKRKIKNNSPNALKYEPILKFVHRLNLMFYIYFKKQNLLLNHYLSIFYIIISNIKLRIFCVLKLKKRNLNQKYCDFIQILMGMSKVFRIFSRKKVSFCSFWKKIVAFGRIYFILILL